MQLNAGRGAFQFAAKAGLRPRPFQRLKPRPFRPAPILYDICQCDWCRAAQQLGGRWILPLLFFPHFFFFPRVIVFFLLFSGFFLVVLTLPTNYHDNWPTDCQPHSRHILIHCCLFSSSRADLFHVFHIFRSLFRFIFFISYYFDEFLLVLMSDFLRVFIYYRVWIPLIGPFVY